MLDNFCSFPVALTGNKTHIILLTSLAFVALASQSCRSCTDAAIQLLMVKSLCRASCSWPNGHILASPKPHCCFHGLGLSAAPRGTGDPENMLQLAEVDGTAALIPKESFPKELREELSSGVVQVPETLRAWCDTGRAGAGWEVTPSLCQLQQSH